MSRNGRHDSLALKRQRGLAALLLITNLVVGVTYWAAIKIDGWGPGMSSAEQIVCIAAFGVSWVSLLVAAGLLEWLPRITSDLLRDAGDNTRATKRIAAFIAYWRMVPFYIGVFVNLFAVAALAEFTGGLTESPFIAFLVALVLIGQQVSRFKLQAGVLLAYSALLVAAMIALDGVVTEPPDGPFKLLSPTLVLLSFAVGGLLNLYEKNRNYRIKKNVKPPTQVRVYRDGRGIWRFALHRQDPVLYLGPCPCAERGTPQEAKEALEKHADEMGKIAEWGELDPDWPETCDDGFIVPLRDRSDPPCS